MAQTTLFIFYSHFLSGNSTQNLGKHQFTMTIYQCVFFHTSRLCARWSKSNGRALEGWMFGKVACAGTCRKSRLRCGTPACAPDIASSARSTDIVFLCSIFLLGDGNGSPQHQSIMYCGYEMLTISICRLVTYHLRLSPSNPIFACPCG